MSDPTDHGPVLADAAPAARVAYTINNDQPVRCTLISDEPLFYIDAPLTEDELDELDLGEEFFLNAHEILEGDSSPSALPIEADPDQIFKEQFAASPAETETLEDTVALLRCSRLAGALLDFAQAQGVTLKLCEQMAPVFYDRLQGQITLRPQLSRASRVLLLIRELRRVWQHRQGALIHPLLFHPDHAIVINRVQAADLATMVVRVAWELRLAGKPEIWEELDQNGYHDLTRSFGREALLDFRSLNNGRACAAAFEAWFLSERCRSFDRNLIQKMLADYQSYVFRAGHAESSRVLTQQLISALGEMPYGKNYLSSYAGTILADPIFTDIRDRSNANFLWFIKFEQSFRATERDLQQEGGLPSSAQGSPSHASDSTATVLRLPVPHETRRATRSRVQARGGAAAVIVDLEQWRRGSHHH